MKTCLIPILLTLILSACSSLVPTRVSTPMVMATPTLRAEYKAMTVTLSPTLWVKLTGTFQPPRSSPPRPTVSPTPQRSLTASPTATPRQTGRSITGRVLWGLKPVAGAHVNLEKGDWFRGTSFITSTRADANGQYAFENPPADECSIVAAWPDGTPSQVPGIPIYVSYGATYTQVDVHLIKKLAVVAMPNAEVTTTENLQLQWSSLAGLTHYQVRLMDAGTMEAVLDQVTEKIDLPLPAALKPGRTYEWAVHGLDANDQLLATSTGRFKVKSALASVTPQCATEFDRRKLEPPYQRIQYTLSSQELKGYLEVMGIKSLCIPPQLGAPFLYLDWDANGNPLPSAEQGRMLSIGFENLRDEILGHGDLIYATYDFGTGTEYNVFADPADRDAVRQHTAPFWFEVNGVEGFKRIQPVLWSHIALAHVFPFENYYVAVTADLSEDETGNTTTEELALIKKFEKGEYPAERQEMITLLDQLKSSLRFKFPSGGQPLVKP